MQFRKSIQITAVIVMLITLIALPVSAVIYEYDGNNRLLSVDYEDGLKVFYGYDEVGNLRTVLDKLEVLSTNPINNAANVAVDQDIEIVFNISIEPEEQFDSIKILDENDLELQPISRVINGSKVILNPEANLINGSIYQVIVPTGSVAAQYAGVTLAEDYVFSFNTGGVSVVSTIPENESIDVPVSSDITLTFSVPIKAGDQYGSIRILDDNDIEVQPINKLINNSTLTIDPQNNLEKETSYRVIIPAASVLEDGTDIPIHDYEFNFMTELAEPEIVSTIPANGSSGFWIDDDVNVTFSVPVIMGEQFQYIRILDENDNEVQLISRVIDGSVLTLNPQDDLQKAATYQVIIPLASVKTESHEIPLAEDYIFSFTTELQGPEVVSTVPQNGQTGVAVNTSITINFSSWCQQGSNFSSIVLLDRNDSPITISKLLMLDELILTPTSNLLEGMTYQVIIPAAAVKSWGTNIPLAREYNFTFTTEGGNSAPEVISTIPAHNSTGVPVSNDISIQFSAAVLAGDYFDDIDILDINEVAVENVSRTINGDTLSLNPQDALGYEQTYHVFIPAGAVKNANNNLPLAADYSFSFTTAEMVAPTVQSTIPTNNSTGVPVDNDVSITCSSSIIAGDYFDDIEILDANDVAIDNLNRTIDNNTITLSPPEDLDYEQAYHVFIPAGAFQDAINNLPLAADYEFLFTTEGEITSGPQVVSTNPADGATGVSVNQTVTVTFSVSCQSGSTFNSIAILDENDNSVMILKLVIGTNLTLNPLWDLQTGKTYRVIIPAGAVKEQGTNEPMADTYEFSFTT